MVPTVDQSSQKIMDLRKKLYTVTRNTGKRLKWQELTIRDQKKVNKEHGKMLTHTSAQFSLIQKRLDAVNHRATYWKQQAGEM